MHALANAGQQTNSRYVDLTYVVAENEEEEEQRDFSRVAKATAPVLNHSGYSCIGSQTCLKQKNIRKLFPNTLRQCEEMNKANQVGAKKVKGATDSTVEGNSFISLNSKVNSTALPGIDQSMTSQIKGM